MDQVRPHLVSYLVSYLDADSETDAISDIQPVQNVTPNVRQTSVILASVAGLSPIYLTSFLMLSIHFFGILPLFRFPCMWQFSAAVGGRPLYSARE